MPIQTNLALETAFFHVPLPAAADDVERLNACWQHHPLKRGRILAGLGTQDLVLTIETPVVLVAVNDNYWKELGAIIARTGEPWWDFCAIVVDNEPQAAIRTRTRSAGRELAGARTRCPLWRGRGGPVVRSPSLVRRFCHQLDHRGRPLAHLAQGRF